MRLGLLLPVAALLSGCATEAALITASAPDAVTPVPEAPQAPAPLLGAPAMPAPAKPAQTAPAVATPATAATAVPTATPITLSQSQTSAIHDALWRVIEDPAWVKLGAYSAGVDPSGVITVCGAFNTRNSFGAFSGMKPFRGEFRGAEFKPSPLGGTNNVVSATLASCERAGLPIKLQGG